ncbi:MAG: hypothetical protein LW707_09740, partial [Sphingobacteriales bacterium]|nr:hypothetical protein [Sphingobacteriales bacterium]
ADSRNINLPPAGTIHQDTLKKLRGVELVLIKAEVLAAYWTASYLLAQRKGRSAVPFADSSLNWSMRFGLTEEQAKVLSLKIQVSESIGDRSGADRSRELLSNLNDSLKVAPLLNTIDSLKSRLAQFEQQPTALAEDDKSETGNSSNSSTGLSVWMFISALLAATTLLYYRKSKQTPPPSHSPGSSDLTRPVSTQANIPSGNGNSPIGSGNRPKPASPPQSATLAPTDPDVPLFIPVVQDQKPKNESADSRNINLPPAGTIHQDTLKKLRGVELVLIKAEVLAAYVKDYLRQFGMASTEKLIDEVETESSTERISRLLSKVFQVRNHCRRAADETKSILTNLN